LPNTRVRPVLLASTPVASSTLDPRGVGMA